MSNLILSLLILSIAHPGLGFVRFRPGLLEEALDVALRDKITTTEPPKADH